MNLSMKKRSKHQIPGNDEYRADDSSMTVANGRPSGLAGVSSRKSCRNFGGFSILDIAELGMMTALLEAGKHALDFLPNVELVALLLIIFTLHFGLKTIAVALAFTAIETAFFGFQTWVIMYLYIWPALVIIVWLNRRKTSVWFFSILSGLYGLFFGAFCSIPYLFIGGINMAFTWWVAGIPYDIVHCIANFALCLALFKPLNHAMNYILKITSR